MLGARIRRFYSHQTIGGRYGKVSDCLILNGFLRLMERAFGQEKNEVITMQNLNANVAEKTPRQIFAKVPGVFVYDMDGSGNQVNIATWGLDPHRGWEFNIRMNDAITNSDMYGYPASYYSMPMEPLNVFNG